MIKKIYSYIPSEYEELSVEFDERTPCIRHRRSGEIYPTDYSLLIKEDLRDITQAAGWNFNWQKELQNPKREVYKLTVKGETSIQGLLSLEPSEMWVDVHLAESAPWNIGSSKNEFVGVGPHLFAIACKKSFDFGFGGWVAFFAKTNLIEHYVISLKAQSNGHRIVIPPQSSLVLVQSYFS